MYKAILGGLFGVMLLTGSARAQSCTSLPYSFTNGTTADATQVNANFNCVFSNPGFPGPVRINTTTYVGDPSEKLSVENLGSGGVAAGFQGIGTAASSSAVIIGDDAYGTAYAVGFSHSYSGAGIVGSISTTSSGTSYNTTSDERLKVDHGVVDAVPELMRLRIHRFVWKSTNEFDVGLFAQETYKVLPGIVREGGDDPHKNPWQVNYPGLIPRLLAGWQNHERRIVALEALAKETASLSNVPGAPAGNQQALVDEFKELKAANDNQAAEIQQLRTQLKELERRVRVQTAQR